MPIVRFLGSVGTRLALDSVAGKMRPHHRPGIFMTKGIGIDFGTSNSAAAIFDGDEVRLVQLESADAIIPSATYIDRALTSKTGQLAVDQYIADNTGRTVELVPEVIGETSQFVEGGGEDGGPGEVETATEKVYGAAVTDSSLQEDFSAARSACSVTNMSAA